MISRLERLSIIAATIVSIIAITTTVWAVGSSQFVRKTDFIRIEEKVNHIQESLQEIKERLK